MRKFYFQSITALAVILTLWTATPAQSKAFDTSRMDTTADACQDFFQYANGNWVKNTEIPPAFSRWGTFNILADNNQTILKDILEKAAANKSAPKGSDEQLIGDLYASCMDEAAVEKADAKPLNKYFKRIDKLESKEDLQAAIAEFHRYGVPMFFGFGASADAKNSSMTIANANQGGLSLPNRDFYDKTDPKSVEIREKFVDYMTNMFKLLGDSPEAARANAKTVMAIQNRLALASKRPVEFRDRSDQLMKSVADDESVDFFGWIRQGPPNNADADAGVGSDRPNRARAPRVGAAAGGSRAADAEFFVGKLHEGAQRSGGRKV